MLPLIGPQVVRCPPSTCEWCLIGHLDCHCALVWGPPSPVVMLSLIGCLRGHSPHHQCPPFPKGMFLLIGSLVTYQSHALPPPPQVRLAVLGPLTPDRLLGGRCQATSSAFGV